MARAVELRLLRYFVTVAAERHVGRAAERLHMTQPPLSRAIQRLETELGATLFERTPQGVELTHAGEVLLADAVPLLDQADRLRLRVAKATDGAVLRLGSLADTADQAGQDLVAGFRRRQPGVEITVIETDLSDPTAGLRAGRVDLALTRTPFNGTGIATATIRTDPVGVVVAGSDPVAAQESTTVAALAGRTWIRLPDGTDPLWSAYWTAADDRPQHPVVRTIQECLRTAAWNGTLVIAPLGQALPDGLVCVPLADRPPSRVVLAWREDDPSPLVRSFAGLLTGGAVRS
jgi:DNA-binding transcriptional LysR family regulator